MIFMCQSDTTIEFRACKRKGHIRTFQRYFDLLSQQGFPLSLITSIEVDPWILSTAWWASMMHRRNIGNHWQANLWKLSKLWFLKVEVASPMLFRWRNTRTSHRALNAINQWLDIPVRYTTAQKSRHNVGLQSIGFDITAANSLLAA